MGTCKRNTTSKPHLGWSVIRNEKWGGRQLAGSSSDQDGLAAPATMPFRTFPPARSCLAPPLSLRPALQVETTSGPRSLSAALCRSFTVNPRVSSLSAPLPHFRATRRLDLPDLPLSASWLLSLPISTSLAQFAINHYASTINSTTASHLSLHLPSSGNTDLAHLNGTT